MVQRPLVVSINQGFEIWHYGFRNFLWPLIKNWGLLYPNFGKYIFKSSFHHKDDTPAIILSQILGFLEIF